MNGSGGGELNGLGKWASCKEMEGAFLLSITVHTRWDDGMYSSGESGGCGEDVPCNFPEHEFVSSIYFGFPKKLPLKMRERASGRKSCLLVSEVSIFNRYSVGTTGGPAGLVKG